MDDINQHYENLKRNRHLRRVFETTPFVAAALLTGIVGYFYSTVFFYLEERIEGFYLASAWYMTLPITLMAIFLSWWLPKKFAPQAIGSGIPQMLAANELDPREDAGFIESLIGMKVVIFKIIASVVCVAGGGAVGQEGPTLHVSAGIFYFTGRKFSEFFQGFKGKMLVLIGGGAGMAAAFNTPLGGIAYALEELSKEHFNKIKTNMILAVIIAGLCVQVLQGSYLYLGYPTLEEPHAWGYLSVTAISILVGFAGVVFGRLLKSIYDLRGRQSNRSIFALNLFCALVFWALASFLSEKVLGSGKHQIMGILFHDDSVSSVQILVRFVGPLLMSTAGAVGGLFAPSLAVGAVAGSFLGQYLDPSAPHLMALVGMIAFLTGFMRTPFTAFILVLEMTDRHSSLIPMMLASLISYSISKVSDAETFYDYVKHKLLNK